MSHDSPALENYRAILVPDRQIIVGHKYKSNPTACYCLIGCEQCMPIFGPRCWQRRTELEFVYRIREHHYTDPYGDMLRSFLVTLVRPTIWQMRAFAGGSTMTRLAKNPEKWHEVTGLVWEKKIGEEVV